MAPPPKVKPQPYSDCLTPSLHTRFIGAAVWPLYLSFIYAAWFRNPTSFWSWFPLGPAATWTLLLFLCPLSVFILRIGFPQVGTRTTASSLHSLIFLALRITPLLQVFGYYILSALVFVEVYIWTSSAKTNMSIVIHGKPYERPRLNERPIMLRSFFLCAALVQGFAHLLGHADRVALDTRSTSITAPSQFRVVRKKAPFLLARAATTTILTTLLGVPFYFFFRNWACRMHYNVVKHIYNVVPGRSMDIHGAAGVLGRFAYTCGFLSFLWELTNAVFDHYLGEPPLKEGLPLTSSSNDPNHSLLNGMRRRKDLARAMAFWELLIITTNFDSRRHTIYDEIQRPDRTGGSTWAAVSTLCLDEIKGIGTRITAAVAPPPPPAEPQEPQVVVGLPRISKNLETADKILINKPSPNGVVDSVFQGVNKTVKAHRDSPQPAVQVAREAKALLDLAMEKGAQSGRVKEKVGGVIGNLLQIPGIGTFFRQTFSRKATAIVCGYPYSRTTVIVPAIVALTRLTVHSLKEDKHGSVQESVLGIMRCFASTIKAIEGLLETLAPHWTDVEFCEDQRKKVAEVNVVLEALRAGLGEMLMAFGEFMDYLGAESFEVKELKGLVREWQERYERAERLKRRKDRENKR